MSEEFKEFYYHQPFHDDQQQNTAATTFTYSGSHSSAYAGHDTSSTFSADHSSVHNDLQMFDPTYLSFTEFLHGSTDYNSFSGAFGMSPSSSEAFSIAKEEQTPAVEAVGGGGETTPATPNSSISSSSTEAAPGDEDSNKGKKGVKETLEDAEDDSSKKE